MGNLDALRDWGHAKDYVRMQWLMLQQNQPDDYVIATGKQFSVRQFIKWAAEALGIEVSFSGEGLDEVGVVVSVEGDRAPCVSIGDVIIRVDPRYFRLTEVQTLLGDPTKAKNNLGWMPEISAKAMCEEMVASDLTLAIQKSLLKKNGYGI